VVREGGLEAHGATQQFGSHGDGHCQKINQAVLAERATAGLEARGVRGVRDGGKAAAAVVVWHDRTADDTDAHRKR